MSYFLPYSIFDLTEEIYVYEIYSLRIKRERKRSKMFMQLILNILCFFIYNLIYLLIFDCLVFSTVQAFSSCGEWGHSLAEVHGLLVAASLIAGWAQGWGAW